MATSKAEAGIGPFLISTASFELSMLLPIIFIDVDSAIVKPSIFFISSAIFPMLLNMGLLAMAAAEPAKDANFR